MKYKKYYIKNIILAILACGFLLFSVVVYATEIFTVISESDEGILTYSYKEYGTFETNVKQSGCAEFGYFDFSENLKFHFLYEGTDYDFKNGDVLYNSGNYDIIIMNENCSDYAVFEFTIKNDYFVKDMYEYPDKSKTIDSDTVSAYDKSDNINDQTDLNDNKESQEDMISKIFNTDEMSSDSNIEWKEILENKISKDDVNSTINQYGDENITRKYFTDSDDTNNVIKKEISYIGINKENRLMYGIDNIFQIESSIPNNAYTSDKVYLKSADGEIILIKFNGEIILENSDHTYCEPGSYDVFLYKYAADEKENTEDEDISLDDVVNSKKIIYESHFLFNIIPEVVNDLTLIKVPQNFKLNKIIVNGGVDKNIYNFSYKIKEEGFYEFEFMNKENSNIKYSLKYELDETAPIIAFSKDIDDKKVKLSPLSLRCDEEDATITINKDGTFYEYKGENLISAGCYKVMVSDIAGNIREYSFSIQSNDGERIKNIFLIGLSIIGCLVALFLVNKNN